MKKQKNTNLFLRVQNRHRQPPPPNRPQVSVIPIPRDQRRSPANPPAAQASWFLVCWSFVADVWRGVKKGVEDGAKATKKRLTDLWGGFKKGVCTVWKAVSDGARFVYKRIKWALEETLILYERADSYFIPPQDAWWVNFIREAKIPALKEVIKQNTRIHVRIIWLVVFIVAFWNASNLSVAAYKHYEMHPIEYKFEPHETEVGDVPFPSIALSWTNNLKTAFLELIEEALRNIRATGTEIIEGIEYNATELSTLVEVLLSFCKPKVSLSTALNFFQRATVFRNPPPVQTEILDQPDSEMLAGKIVPALQKAGEFCSSRIVYCAWNGVEVPCSVMFKPQLTESGISCVFNKMPVSLMRRNPSVQTLINDDKLTNGDEISKWKKWNLEKTINNQAKKHHSSSFSEIPLTQKSDKKTSGATFVINTDEHDSTCPQFDSSGPRVSLSFPLDDHNHETEHFATPPNSFVKVNAVPKLIMADREIEDVTKEKRACLFSNEGSLEYYEIYTQNNCKKECLANFIRKKFNCSLLSMPNSNGTRLCKVKELTKVLFSEEHLRSDECTKKCPPTCNSLSYKTDTQVERLSEETIDSLKQSFNFTTSVVHVSLPEGNVIAKRRSLRHSISDIIGLIGGLFGTILNFTYLTWVQMIFAGWFLRPPLIVLIKLILRSLLWILLHVCCCQFRKKVSASSEDNDSSTVPASNNDQTESPTETPENDVSQSPPSPADTTSDVVVEIEDNEVENIFTTPPTPNLQNV